MKPWQLYQEDAAAFFRLLGLSASTDVTLQGVRTKHDVDVFVELDVAGFPVRWIVECKHWKDAVSKLHVLALREIVADLGADRGILLCEAGFQEGAVEAASLTNVQVTSLASLKVTSKDTVYAVRLHELFDRVEACRQRYWDIPKRVRIDKGLRPDIGDANIYSGAHVIETSEELLRRAFRGVYPIDVDPLLSFSYPQIPAQFDSSEAVVGFLKELIDDLEAKLDAV